MNRFIILNGLPYLYDADKKKAFAVRWDEKGFTVGAEIKLKSAPKQTFSELSIKAKCASCLDSIGGADEPEETEQEKSKQEESAKIEPKEEIKPEPAKKTGGRKKAAKK